MPKFNFSVNTRDGHKVPSIQIYGANLHEAERKLRQMYMHCEVTQSSMVDESNKFLPSANIEDLLSLIVSESTAFCNDAQH